MTNRTHLKKIYLRTLVVSGALLFLSGVVGVLYLNLPFLQPKWSYSLDTVPMSFPMAFGLTIAGWALIELWLFAGKQKEEQETKAEKYVRE